MHSFFADTKLQKDQLNKKTEAKFIKPLFLHKKYLKSQTTINF